VLFAAGASVAFDMLVHRMDILFSPPAGRLVQEVGADIASMSPEAEVVPHELAIADAWDFELVYAALFDFARNYPFDTEHEDYWIHIATGSHVAQICLFLRPKRVIFPDAWYRRRPAAARQQGSRHVRADRFEPVAV
jgi:transcriptional regulatory protein RtcR